MKVWVDRITLAKRKDNSSSITGGEQREDRWEYERCAELGSWVNLHKMSFSLSVNWRGQGPRGYLLKGGVVRNRRKDWGQNWRSETVTVGSGTNCPPETHEGIAGQKGGPEDPTTIPGQQMPAAQRGNTGGQSLIQGRVMGVQTCRQS